MQSIRTQERKKITKTRSILRQRQNTEVNLIAHVGEESMIKENVFINKLQIS